MSYPVDYLVRSSEGRVLYDLQANAVCTQGKSSTRRVTAQACSPTSLECNSACALHKSKTKAVSSYLKQLYEAYPTFVAGIQDSYSANEAFYDSDSSLDDFWIYRWFFK